MNNAVRHPQGLWIALLFIPAMGCGNGDEPVVETTQSSLANETVLYRTSQATVVQDGDWVRWRFANPLSKAPNTVIYRGKRNAEGGCDFSGTASATIDSPQALVRRERGIATNINQCLMEVEQAQVPVEAMAAADGQPAAGHTLQDAPGAEGGSDLQLEDGYFHTGYYNQYMTDPVGIRVTQNVAHVDWNNNGACIGSWHRYYSWDRFWESSWSLNSISDLGTPGGTGPCDKVWEQSFAYFINYAFCALTATTVNSTVEFDAFPYNSQGTWGASVSGLCYWMLSYHQDYKPW